MMKKMIASVLILAGMLSFAGCTDAAPETPDGGVPEAARTSAELPARSPRAVILTYGNEAHYRLDKALDYEAFLDWLAAFYGALCGDQTVVAISDIIADSGVITVLAEYHTAASLETGRNSDTVCGGCNLFFDYNTTTGRDFAEQKFAGDALLHSYDAPAPLDLSDWTVTVDTQGAVQLVKAGETPIKTPAVYRWDLANFSKVQQLYVNGDNIVLALPIHAGGPMEVTKLALMVYASKDGGATWSEQAIDYTPITTTVRYPVTNLVLSMRSADKGTLIVGTNRCEVFFYTTDDGGKKWTKQRSFKLLNYQNEALLDGGMVTDTLGFITFIPRKGKNPNVYITYDGGKTWALMDITLPEGYSDADAYGTAAYLEESRVILPIVCSGGKLHYISEDEGKTWSWQK